MTIKEMLKMQAKLDEAIMKEYKLHQERANERRYRSGEESWHRGSVVAKKK